MATRIVWIIAFLFIPACGGGGGGTSGPPSRFLYVAADSGPNEFYTQIFSFAAYSGGGLRTVSGITPTSQLPQATNYPGGGPVVITPDSKYLYTVDSNELTAFQINPDGSLKAAPGPSFTTTDTKGLVAHPTAEFLYASSISGVLSVLAIDSGTGALNQASSVSLGGNSIIELVGSAVITPDGKYLYQAAWLYPNGAGQPAVNQLAVFSIDSTSGALSAVPGSPFATVIAPDGDIVIDPTGKFLYATIAPEKELVAFSIDATSGTLTAVTGSPVALKGYPGNLAIDASGSFLVVSVGSATVANCLYVFSIDPVTGALASVSGSPFGPAANDAALVADPSEPIIYAGMSTADQAGPGNSPAILYALSVDQTTGALAPIGQVTVPDSQKVEVSYIATTR